MFTGIVQATGIVRTVRQHAAGARLVVDAPDLRRPLADGCSICVNGVCLTVVRSDDTLIEFDVVPETLNRSNLGAIAVGGAVNLEPSLCVGDALDGHMVQGHVDGTARVMRIRTAGPERLWTFAPQQGLMPFIIPKGSVALDGVSLTIADVEHDGFTVALIPTTLSRTTLGRLKVGDRVNVETDILARTVVATLARWREQAGAEPLTVELLRANGW